MIERISVQGPLVGDVSVREPSSDVNSARERVVLLHGYSQSGDTMLKLCGTAISRDALVFSLNAPYPIPERKGGEKPSGWKVGFSWYFYDFSTDEYYIDMKPALAFAQGAIEELSKKYGNVGTLPLRIVGFSQGGYFAPFLAAAINEAAGSAVCRQVIGIGCRYLDEELPGGAGVAGRLDFRCDQIQGAADEVVPLEPSRESHRRLVARGVQGEFVAIPGVGHRITHEVQAELKRMLTLT